VAFPVDDKTIFRFNYGQFYQQPNLQDLYVSYRFLQYKIRRGGYFVGFGNPNLKPEHTTAYEAGIQRQMGDNIRLDVTAYYKDVKDLVQITSIPSFPNNFSSYRNQDFATIKGLDFGFAMRPINHFSAQLNYSLSYAKGTGSVSQTNRFRAWTQNEPPKQTAPLDFDQRHKLSANFDWRLNRGEGPQWSGRRWLEGTGLNVLINVASGTPYTPTVVYNELTLAATTGDPAGSLNSRYGPWTASVDFKASKRLGLGLWNMEVYAWVLNLFNNENAITVYTSSGTPYSTTFLNTQPGEAFVETAAEQEGVDGEALYRLAEDNPTLFASPRLVRFGLRMSF
jgi:outer membrane receptor protein involved in Fe transport